jgi:hypothetical protein
MTEEYHVLGCEVVQVGGSSQTIRGDLLPPFSESKIHAKQVKNVLGYEAV